MVLWFAGMSLVLAWNVFRDPALDHRLVIVGALLPDLVDAATAGGTGVLHSLIGATALLVAVMVCTLGRRQLRRRLLALSIGVFFHLVLDGAWALSESFWWPLTGWPLGVESLPAMDRPLWLTVAMEVAGLVALIWAYRRFGLADSKRRQLFLRQGRLDRAVTGAEPPG